jgi:hypothetical protein
VGPNPENTWAHDLQADWQSLYAVKEALPLAFCTQPLDWAVVASTWGLGVLAGVRVPLAVRVLEGVLDEAGTGVPGLVVLPGWEVHSGSEGS